MGPIKKFFLNLVKRSPDNMTVFKELVKNGVNPDVAAYLATIPKDQISYACFRTGSVDGLGLSSALTFPVGTDPKVVQEAIKAAKGDADQALEAAQAALKKVEKSEGKSDDMLEVAGNKAAQLNAVSNLGDQAAKAASGLTNFF